VIKVIKVNVVIKVLVVLKVKEVNTVKQVVEVQEVILVFLSSGKVLGKKMKIIIKMMLYIIMGVHILL
jgi:hypothetical protein